MSGHRVGIMQGRLSASVDGRIQSFPTNSWREEFALAQACGFEVIEWVFEFPDWRSNPVFIEAERQEIIDLQAIHGVTVSAVCADYFMERPLTGQDVVARVEAQGVLLELVRRCSRIGANIIELPLIGPGSLSQPEAAQAAVDLLRDLTPMLESCGVDLLLELDLPPRSVYDLMTRIESPRVGLNYDTGNSAYWGFEPEDEIPLYGRWIRNVHIKDVTKAEYSVPLGMGVVAFDKSFALLRDAGFSGDFVLQTARDKDDVGAARRYRDFARAYVQRYFT